MRAHARLSRRQLLLAASGTVVTGLMAACVSAPPAASPSVAAPQATATLKPAANSTGPTATQPTTAPAQQADRASTLIVAAPSLASTFDMEKVFNPAGLELMETMYDHLVTSKRVQNQEGGWEYDFSQLQPELAERWESTDGGKTITFFLRKGVKSDYGNEFGADDVKWQWERMAGIKANGLNFFAQASLNGPEDVEVVDKSTVRFHLQEPNSLFFKLLQNSFMYYFDSTESKKHATADDPYALAWTERNAAAYGPYRVTQHVPGQQTLLEARPDYWAGPPAMKRIIYREVPSPTVRSQLVQSGEVDLAEALEPRLLQDLKDKPGVKVMNWTSTSQVALVMNVTKPPFDSQLVRQAVNYAVPYDDIVKSVYLGTATRWKSPVPSIFAGYTDKFWHYDTSAAKAKDLLAQAGYGSGFETTLSFTDAFAEHEAMAVLLKTALSQVGIAVNLEKLPSAQYAQRTARKELPFLIYQMAPGTPDVAFSIQLYLAGQAGPNYAQYNNPELAQLVAESIRTTDEAKRLPMFERMQQMVVEDAPWAFLAMPGYHLAARQDLQDVTWHPVNVLRIGTITRK